MRIRLFLFLATILGYMIGCADTIMRVKGSPPQQIECGIAKANTPIYHTQGLDLIQDGLEAGERIPIIGYIKDESYQIQRNGKIGWILMDAIEECPDA